MLNRVAFVCASALLAAGCGSGDGDNQSADGNAVAATPAAQATFAGTMRAGRWEVASTGDVDGTETLCITAEQVQRSSFVGNSLADQPQCTVVRDRMTGGTIDVEVACGAGRHPMRMRGTYTAQSFAFDSTLEIPTGQGTETIRAQRTGRWVADQCTGAEGPEDGGAEDEGQG